MKSLSCSLKSGLMALGLVAGMAAAPSLAGPIIQPDLSGATSSAAPQVIPVRESWAGNGGLQIQDWRWRNHGNWKWRSGNFGNRYIARNWNGGNWNGDRRWYHHRRHFRGGDAAILGLGLGLGLGSLPYYDNYDPYYYDPYPRYYQPRRLYRTERLSNAHVRWCYNRYRSYRAWDNTFQPNHGSRKQCWSPYS